MELQLVERVELKLLLADTDAKLTTSLETFLCPLLQKVASPNMPVVTKVVEVLSFVKMRQKQSSEVGFPLKKLLDLYKAGLYDFSPGMIRQNRQVLSFIGLELQNSNRNTVCSEIELLNYFVDGLRNDQIENADVNNNVAEQFSLFLLVLIRMVKSEANLSVSEWDERDSIIVQKRLVHFFLVNFRVRLNAQPLLTAAEAAFFTEHNAKNNISLMPDNDFGITLARKAVLKLAHEHPFLFKYVLVAAMGDPILDISRQARSDVLKLRGFDNKVLQNWAIHGNDTLITETIDLIIRERAFDNIDHKIITTAFERDDLRLRQTALRLLRELKNSFRELWDAEINLKIGKLLHQYIIDDGWPRSQLHSTAQIRLRQMCYELIGVFMPSDSILNFLFQSLERDTTDMAQSIQKSISSILEAGSAAIQPEKLLQYMKHSQSSRTRYSAVKFAILRLDPKSPIQRIICLLGLDPIKNRSDVIIESQRGLLSESEANLPDFSLMLNEVSTQMDLLASPTEVVSPTLLFLFACLVRYVPTSTDWSSELTASITLSISPLKRALSQSLPETLPFLQLLLSFVIGGPYHEVVPLLLRQIFIVLPASDMKQLHSSGIVNSNHLLQALNQANNEYGTFMVEYLPLIAPEINVVTANSGLEVLAQAFRAAILNLESDELSKAAVETKNLAAIEILSVSNHLKLDAEVENVVKNSQMTIACLAIHENSLNRNKLFTQLLESSPKSFDEIVANGEAISVAASGWHSKVIREKYPYLISQFGDSFDSQNNWLLENKALESIVAGIRGSPESRRIAAVRLLCLTQYSFYNIADYPGVANGIQSCFMSLLSDSDDVTQESAGRGLGILFEYSSGDSKLQNILLSTLLSSFTDDRVAKKHTAGMLTAETQIFEPGTLPSDTRGKGSISTYKDVLNLANETGDSSLVYKFMSLSASSQIWASRKGIAFSLEQILSKSELATHTTERTELGQKLIPKLFRYLYDPIEVTKQAMKHIWSALVPTTHRTQTVKLYLPEIKAILFEGVVEREWRVREASTSALSDLVSQGYLEDTVDLWKAGFRAVDDIKESVNKVGSELLKTLTNSLVRANSAGRPSDLGEIIPFLIKGLANEATVQFSVDTLLKLSETKGFKPWAAPVLEELCLQLSSLEPQALNYLALNTSQHLVDEARVKGLRSSPIMQGLEAMVERGTPSTDEMWEILPRIVKKGVGVSSKLAGGRLIILTCMHTFGADKKGTEALLNVTMNELWGSNEVISNNYASAISYLCRQLPITSVLKYVHLLKDKFINSQPDEEKIREIIGIALQNLSSNATDAFSSVSSDALPLAFIGKLTSEKPEAYRKVWDENTGGNLSLRLYFNEIVRFCLEILQNSSVRSLKVTAGKALSEVFSAQSSINVNKNMNQTVHLVASSLLTALTGRTWPGKEHLFSALVSVYPAIADAQLNSEIELRVLNEIQRKNSDYKLGILPHVSRFLGNFTTEHPDRKEYVSQVEQQMVSGFIDVADEDSDVIASTLKGVYSALKSPDLMFDLVQFAADQPKWNFRVALCESIQQQPFDERIWSIVTKRCASDEQYERVRLEWCRAAGKFRDQTPVISDIHSRLKQEKSNLIVAELKELVK